MHNERDRCICIDRTIRLEAIDLIEFRENVKIFMIEGNNACVHVTIWTAFKNNVGSGKTF